MTKHEARAVAEAIMWKHALQPEHGRRFIPDPEAMKSAITSALLSATREQAEAVRVLAEVAAEAVEWFEDWTDDMNGRQRDQAVLVCQSLHTALSNTIAKAAIDAAGGA